MNRHKKEVDVVESARAALLMAALCFLLMFVLWELPLSLSLPVSGIAWLGSFSTDILWQARD